MFVNAFYGDFMKIDFSENKHFGLIGFPLGHSMSAVIHNELFKISKTNGSYGLIEIEKNNLEYEFKNNLLNLNGFNVTIPHKLNIIPYLDKLSAKAQLFGSVNTVDIRDGKAVGYNTDCVGFLRALEMANIQLKGNVLLLGSGGASRMIAFESVLADCDLTLAVRNTANAQNLKNEIYEKMGKICRIVSLDDVGGEFDLIVNGTPVGMYPNINACPLSEKVIQNSGAVYDVIYNPIKTQFIKYAENANVKCCSGLSMLVWQAAAAQEIWNGVKFDYDDIEKVISVVEKELKK